MKRILLLGFLVIVGVGAFIAWKFTHGGLTISITQSQIQSQLSSKFPIEKNYLLVNVVLSDPKVILKDNSDRVFIGSTITVSVPIEGKQSGSTLLSGNVTYDSNQGAFLLTDLRVEDLQVAGLSGQKLDTAKNILGQIGAQVLNRMPIYQLNANDQTQRLAKGLLKSVKVANGTLQITLGL